MTSLASHLDDAFLNRVARCYQVAARSFQEADGSIWTGINGLRQQIHDLLLASNISGLRKVFTDPIGTDLYYGVDNLAASIEKLIVSQSSIDAGMANLVKDQIYTLSSGLGLVRWTPAGCEHFDAYRSSEHFEPSPTTDELLGLIDHRLGAKVLFPTPFAGERGLETERGLATYRAVHAIYQAIRIKQELQTTQTQSVLEIGPGMGRTVYYAFKAGVSDYTTIDLPLGVVAQACFLGATLGPDAIWLEGDEFPTKGRVRLLSSTRLAGLDERFGVVLNVDSLTEMGVATATEYASWIVSHADVFLSINHEGNRATVPKLANTELASAHYRRFPYWLRPAYAEELFRMRER